MGSRLQEVEYYFISMINPALHDANRLTAGWKPGRLNFAIFPSPDWQSQLTTQKQKDTCRQRHTNDECSPKTGRCVWGAEASDLAKQPGLRGC